MEFIDFHRFSMDFRISKDLHNLSIDFFEFLMVFNEFARISIDFHRIHRFPMDVYRFS